MNKITNIEQEVAHISILTENFVKCTVFAMCLPLHRYDWPANSTPVNPLASPVKPILNHQINPKFHPVLKLSICKFWHNSREGLFFSLRAKPLLKFLSGRGSTYPVVFHVDHLPWTAAKF